MCDLPPSAPQLCSPPAEDNHPLSRSPANRAAEISPARRAGSWRKKPRQAQGVGHGGEGHCGRFSLPSFAAIWVRLEQLSSNLGAHFPANHFWKIGALQQNTPDVRDHPFCASASAPPSQPLADGGELGWSAPWPAGLGRGTPPGEPGRPHRTSLPRWWLASFARKDVRKEDDTPFWAGLRPTGPAAR